MTNNMGGPRWLELGWVYQTDDFTVWNRGCLADDPETYRFYFHLKTKRGTATGETLISKTLLLDAMVSVGDVVLSLATRSAEELPDPQ